MCITDTPSVIMKGWQCPVCGAVMAPNERQCINCTGHYIIVPGVGTPVIIPPPTITC